MIPPPGPGEPASWLELFLVLVIAVLGIVALSEMEMDGKPPTQHEWGTGSMSPASRAPRFPCEGSWAWDRPVP